MNVVLITKGDEIAMNFKREKKTVKVKAKALPLGALAQRDCRRCFLYRHCDYILYAICTEFEKGRSTKRGETV